MGVGLFISPEMYAQVRGWVIVECPIEAFVYCNTKNDEIVEALNESSLTLEQYNDFYISGDAQGNRKNGVLMPFMEISNGVSINHDGRHRATALRNAGKTHIPVALINIRSMGAAPLVIRGLYRGEIGKADLLPHLCQ